MMIYLPSLKRRLQEASPVAFILMAGLVAFTAYGCVYAFRKPFTAASFSGLEIWGIQYKIALVIAQVAGYALSKFLGIRIISGLKVEQRALALLLLTGVAWVSLLGFSLSPMSWGPVWLFMNGLPLGMAWGVVFSYLEGRRVTEALAALLCVNFIISSGFVKTTGKWLVLQQGFSEFQMPLVAASLFLPILLLCIWLLEHLPPPSEADQLERSERRIMTQKQRKKLFKRYAPGLILLTGIYLLLTIIRDMRDNFAVEIWAELGLGNSPAILTSAEIPIALLVLLVTALLVLVKNNFNALQIYHAIIALGAVVVIVSTLMFQQAQLSPVVWMIISGSGVILPYILFNGVIFDRLLAAFQEKGNVGFLMYIADAVGYLGSVAVMLWKNFGQSELSWTDFFIHTCLYGSGMMLILTLLSWGYFRQKHRA